MTKSISILTVQWAPKLLVQWKSMITLPFEQLRLILGRFLLVAFPQRVSVHTLSVFIPRTGFSNSEGEVVQR